MIFDYLIVTKRLTIPWLLTDLQNFYSQCSLNCSRPLQNFIESARFRFNSHYFSFFCFFEPPNITKWWSRSPWLHYIKTFTVFLLLFSIIINSLLLLLLCINYTYRPRDQRTGPSALVLSPTRELAQQIEKEVNKINYKGIRRYSHGFSQLPFQIFLDCQFKEKRIVSKVLFSLSSITFIIELSIVMISDLNFLLGPQKSVLLIYSVVTWHPIYILVADEIRGSNIFKFII